MFAETQLDWYVLMNLYIFASIKTERAHTCERSLPNNIHTMAADTKKGITKGMATKKTAKQKTDIKECTELIQCLNTRGVRGAKLESLEDCIDYLTEYVDWCRANPLMTNEVLKGGQAAGTLVPVPKLRALSVGAFCLFIGWSIKDFNKNAEKLLKLAEDGNEEAEVLSLGYSLIKETITTDMDESALGGLVDANYMAKLRGLRDLKDVTSNGKEAGTKAMQVNVLSEDAVNNLKKLGAI